MKVLGVLGGMMLALTGTVASAGGATEAEILKQMLEDRQRRIESGELAGEALAAFEAEIDAYAGQKDAVRSGLYWYRDLAQAQRTAAETGKPILSLRLLGQLDCDLSCANSRFFRTVLYANAELSTWLEQRFVLHWQSVRPVPVVTIDFGDGRVLRRTVTGNSIHYVLTPSGQVVDAQPGLYGPRRFREQLEVALRAAGAAASAPDANAVLQEHQAMRLLELSREGSLALQDTRDLFPPVVPPTDGEPPTAAEAAPRAMGKMMVERPLVRVTTGEDPSDPVGLGPALGPVALDASSRALMRSKLAPTKREGRAFEAVVTAFEAVVAEDQAQNELLLRPRILRKLLEAPIDVDALNRWVYADVFLTPDSDPWLGLDAGGAYAALDGGGILEGAALDD